MKSPLKGTNILEKIGFALIVLSLFFMLLYRQFDGSGLAKMMEEHELFFWVGLLFWALGYIMREQTETIKTRDSQDEETKG